MIRSKRSLLQSQKTRPVTNWILQGKMSLCKIVYHTKGIHFSFFFILDLLWSAHFHSKRRMTAISILLILLIQESPQEAQNIFLSQWPKQSNVRNYKLRSFCFKELFFHRKCIGQYNLCTDKKKLTLPGCWVVCDPEEGQLFYGARRFSDGLSLYKVSWSGM